MTPIGHLTSSAVLAGSAGLLKPRELKWATLWYAIFLVVFSILRAIIPWGEWGLHTYDTFSDAPFYLLLISVLMLAFYWMVIGLRQLAAREPNAGR